MAMPCLPAYGIYHHYLLKAARKQQAAYAALHLEGGEPQDLNEVPDSSAEALEVVKAVAGVATDITTAPLRSLVTQALIIAKQHGFSIPESVSVLEASMPRSKPEKQANKQAMATVSTQLNPMHIKLQPRTCDKLQPPRLSASSSVQSHLLLTAASRSLQPVSLPAVAKQQLLSFCSTPTSAHNPQTPVMEALPVQIGREKYWGSQSSITLEEPIFCTAAAAADRPWQTAEAEAIKHPDPHNSLTFNGCTMQCPEGGFGNLWLELADDTSGTCDALYTKVEAMSCAAQPRQQQLLARQTLDILIESMFKANRRKDGQLHSKPQTALENHPAAPLGGQTAVCLQRQVTTVAAVAACSTAQQSPVTAAAAEATAVQPAAAGGCDESLAAARSTNAACHQQSTADLGETLASCAQQIEPTGTCGSSQSSQEAADLLLEEPMLGPLDSQGFELSPAQQQNRPQLTQGGSSQLGHSLMPAAHRATEQLLVTLKQLVCFAAAQPVGTDNKLDVPDILPAAAAAAAPHVAVVGILAAAADEHGPTVFAPWENYTAVDFEQPELLAKPAAMNSSRPCGKAVQQHPLQLPNRVAACVLPTARLLQGSTSSSRSMIRNTASPKQQCKQNFPDSRTASGPGSSALIEVLQSAVVAAAAASSPRKRRNSSRFAETPVCAAAAIQKLSVAATPGFGTPLQDQSECSHALQHCASLQDSQQLQQQQQRATIDTRAVRPQLLQHSGTPAVVMALRTPLTVAVSAAMTATAISGRPNALSASAVSAAAAATAEAEDLETASQPLPLSPSDMMIEAPVCLHEYKGPLLQEQLLHEVLQVAHLLVMRPVAAAADSHQPQDADGWDPSWGYLNSSTAADSGASSTPWWACQVVDDLFLGQYPPTLQDVQLAGQSPSNPDRARKPRGKCPAGPVDPSHLGPLLLEQMLAADMQVDSSSLLLPVTLFPEDVRLGAAAAAAGGGSGDDREEDFIMQLISNCGCKRQSPAHLELYFDWSWLQPLPTDTTVAAADGAAAAAVGFKRQRSAAETAGAAAAGKRLRHGCDSAIDCSQLGAAVTSAAVAPVPFNIHAWISLLQKQLGPRSVQLFSNCGEPHAVQTDAAAIAAAAAAAAAKWEKREHGWYMHALQECVQLSRQQQQQEPPTCSNHADWGTDAASCLEQETQPAAAAAVAAWEAAHAAGVPAAAAAGGRSAATAPAGTGAAAGPGDVVIAAGGNTTVGAAAAAAASDMDFFMQLQSLAAAAKGGSKAARASKRRLSIAQQQQVLTDANPQGTTEQQDHEVGSGLVPVAGPTSGGGKRSRVGAPEPSGLQDCAEAAAMLPCLDIERDQIVREDVIAAAAAAANDQQKHCVTDLALNGIPRSQPSGAAAAARCSQDRQQQQRIVVVQPPTELYISLPLALLQIMQNLQGNRKAVLGSMQDPDHSLLSCKLWDDLAVQHVITHFHKSAATLQDQSAAGMQQHKQHTRKLGSLLILAQTAGCLLHYGVRVAHLFLQHSLQKLPSLAAACAEAAAALARAYEAVEKLPAAAVHSSSSSASGGALVVQEDHPKLGRLRDLLVQLKAAKVGCKVLLVAETKAFFSLYQTISAAGLTAVQLDRTKKLLQTSSTAAAAAAGGDQVVGDTNPAAAAAAAAAWEAAVAAALGSGQCVLTTHEHLMHNSMPVDLFDYLVEYMTLDNIPAAAAAASRNASSSIRRDEVVANFSGCHYVIQMVAPDLRQAAADIAAAAAAAAEQQQQQQQSSVADLPRLWPSTAAAATAAEAAELHSTVDPRLPAVTPATAAAAAAAAAADLHTTAAAAAAVEVDQSPQAPAGPQYPIVLNRSSGSLLHQRKTLYESLLQLEGQGYLLVERNLNSAAAAAAVGGSRGIGSSITAAVDIVLSPVACLIIWGEARLSQDASSIMAQLSQALLQLSMAYEAVHLIFELPDSVLQLTVKQLPYLQQVAAVVGVRLHIMISFSAANTQDYVHAICKSAASRFWSSSSSSEGLTPPSISDLPTSQEAFLNSCCALNPLSAAVLANKGISLQSLVGLLAAGQSDQGDEQSKQLLTQLSVGVPERSMQLLAAQVTALHLKLESDSPQLPRTTGKRKRGLGRADQRLQQQHHQQQQLSEEYAQQQQHEQQQVFEEYAQQQQQHMYQQQPDPMGQQQVPQRHYQTHPSATAAVGYAEAAADWQHQQHRTADDCQQEHVQHMAFDDQQPYPVHADMYDYATETDAMPGCRSDMMDADVSYMHNEKQQRQQQQRQMEQQQPIAGMDIDPAGVLDAFLQNRKHQHKTAAAGGSRPERAPQQQFRQQQQQFSAERVATHQAAHRHMGYMHLPQQQQQEAPVLVDDDELPDIALPFAEMPNDASPHQPRQQQWFHDPYGNLHHQQQQQQEEEEGFDPVFDLPSLQRQHQRGSLYGSASRYDHPPATAAAEAAAYEEEFYGQQMAPAAFSNADLYDESNMASEGVQRPRGENTDWHRSNIAVRDIFGRPAAADATHDLFGVRHGPQTAPSAERLRREVPGMFSAGSALIPPPLQSGHRGARNPMFEVQVVTNSKSKQTGASRAAAGMFASASVGLGDHVGGLGSHYGGDYLSSAGNSESAWDAGFEPATVGGRQGPSSDTIAVQPDLVSRGSRSVKGSLARGIRLGANGPGRGGQGKPTSSATTSRSSLMVEAFMPHRNPSKQLKYKKGFGLAKGKGKQQSKLYWG